ncbi:MAG: alpha-hemolysin [Rheinheimera sp.]|uniref:membrane protein insertion efficiency factor YidD n=1 Tax=Arsukibacterium sp. UBA3155 TaxID=1946058 RepID=UPI000C8E28A7|nr:membrane protein insertion efficiency factor YidD [Arsukibacterium sp. UBA3155]MAD73525.1 alpha-hemolysin [Rheinheimera sp.]|tara:strand:- start:66296 stop:66556 length:261 start_codon:yes stop_codon:yes gene_type:complete
MQRLLLWLIRRYRKTGGGMRWFGIDCNFEPSCSAYTYTAIKRFGSRRGIALGWQRIKRCNRHDSFCKCIEPVPLAGEISNVESATG